MASFLTAVGLGTVLGIIPQITTQRYAEVTYGYSPEGPPCNDFVGDLRPEACLKGAQMAQTAASYTSMARHVLSLLLNSVAGSYSDAYGRRGTYAIC